MKILAKLLPLILSGGVITAISADVPYIFTDGTKASAPEVNANFKHLEERINTLNGDRQEISVDCSTEDPTALAKYLHWDYDDFGKYEYTTFLLTGTCDGPLYIYGDGVRLQSADESSPATLQLPVDADLRNDAYVVMVDGAQQVYLEDLTIDMSLYTSSTYEDYYVTGVLARTSFVRIVNSNITGGIQGVSAFRNAIVRFEGENSVTDFFKVGISAGMSSHIGVRGFITIEANDIISENWVSALNIYDVSSARIRKGSYINFPTTPQDGGSEIIDVGRNSTLEFDSLSDDSGVTNVVYGDIWVGDGGFLQMNNRTTINGSVYGRGGAVVDMRDNALINGEVSFQLNSVLDMEPGSEVNGSVEMRRSSSLRLDNAEINGDLRVRSGSSATLFEGGIDGGVTVRRSSMIDLQDVVVSGDIDLSSGSSATIFETNVSGEVDLDSASVFNVYDNSYVEGDLGLFLSSTADIVDSVIGGRVEMFGHTSLSMDSSQSGFIDATSSALNITDGSIFAGADFFEGTFVHIGNSTTTSDIEIFSGTSSLYTYVDEGLENNTLNGNTLYLCASDETYIDAGEDLGGTILQECRP